MTPEVLAALVMWLRLSPADRNQFHGIVATLNEMSNEEGDRILRRIRDITASIDPGPLKTPCPTCGR